MIDEGSSWGPPLVSGLSPTEGTPGTQITIRGENLGQDPSDLIMLFICGTDCLHTAKWKSPSKIIARVGQANRGLGVVKIATKSGGRGSSNVKFRVFIAQVGPLEESAVWVDETRTVPGREAIRNVAPAVEEKDALGLSLGKKTGYMSHEYADYTSNLRMESFHPQLYLLEHHMDTPLNELKQGLRNMDIDKENEAKKNEQMHKANLYSLINCVDSLAALHNELENANRAGEFAVIKQMANQISEARREAESVFKDVLGRKDRADATRNALSVLTRFKFIFFLNRAIDDNMAKGEYSTILNDYTRAKSLFKDTEVALFKEVMSGLDSKMELFKEEMKHRLIDTPVSFEEQSKLIKYLKILEPDSDPAWECITAYHCWLEDELWKLQETHHKKAVQDSKNVQGGRHMNMIHDTPERQVFVSEMISVLLVKLQSFWKLARTYHITDDRNMGQKHEDINQMLINTINVSSWLLLNALVPKALPDEVIRRYEAQFVQWPPLSSDVNRHVLAHSVNMLRSLVASLLDCQFTSQHVQPLIELCMTVRLKAVSDIVDKGVEAIAVLGRKEDWRQEYISKGVSKTSLPDCYENEVCDCISAVRDVLSTGGYPGEADLFTRERFKQTLVDLFVHAVVSIRNCFDRLLNLRPEARRPNDLDLQSQRDEGKAQVTTKKLLITICNLEYILSKSLKNISRRLNENGVKYADQIYEKSRSKLQVYRQNLVRCYIKIKCSTFQTLIGSATYEYLPDDDVSDYAKEVMMCCVLEQAELELHAPQLTKEGLQASVQNAFQLLIHHLVQNPPRDISSTTQCVIDMSALEDVLSPFLNLETRALLNTYRAELVGRLDQRKLQRCIGNMRNAMRMVIESLGCGIDDEQEVSNI